MHYSRLAALTRTLPFLLCASGLAAPSIAWAQSFQPPSAAEARAATNPAAPQHYTRAQLDQMLAPIALYPDQLLTEVLMAATFPQQVIDAGNWLQDQGNAALHGDQLVGALQPLPWDPSVKSLVAFPQIVTMMIDHWDWTEALGVAFANQQVEMMARVQFLRDRAISAGHLQTTKQLVVQHRGPEIIIEPANPEEIYVPVYNPAEIYGAWPDREAPPVYIPPPRGFYEGAVGAAIGFSVGYAVAAPLWGWGHPDWQRHEVIVDPQRFDRITNVTRVEQNQITITNNTWRRTGPVAPLPEAQRPRPPAAAQAAPPPGTVAPSSVPVLGRERPGPGGSAPGGAAPGTPPGPAGTPAGPAARPGQPTPPPAAEHGPPGGEHPPAAAEHGPPGGPRPPAAVEHGPPGGPNPPPNAEHGPPGVPSTHPGEPPHGPGEERPPGALRAPETPHSAAPPPAAAHPPEAPHPTAPPPAAAHPPESPHPAAPPPPAAHPPEAPHPAAPPPAAAHPPEAPHPAAPPPAAAHPPAPPPHPGAPPPGGKPAPKPGEEEHH
ncbi:MAG: DUF3300 domain-containing protein [Alphaproteobacteria bacterium]|nr:DUF3300 domain-containing protein [Alphaproteobacteria bacterium]